MICLSVLMSLPASEKNFVYLLYARVNAFLILHYGQQPVNALKKFISKRIIKMGFDIESISSAIILPQPLEKNAIHFCVSFRPVGAVYKMSTRDLRIFRHRVHRLNLYCTEDPRRMLAFWPDNFIINLFSASNSKWFFNYLFKNPSLFVYTNINATLCLYVGVSVTSRSSTKTDHQRVGYSTPKYHLYFS